MMELSNSHARRVKFPWYDCFSTLRAWCETKQLFNNIARNVMYHVWILNISREQELRDSWINSGWFSFINIWNINAIVSRRRFPIMFFRRNCLMAYFSCNAVRFLSQPKLLQILAKYFSTWSWQKWYVSMYLNGSTGRHSKSLLIFSIDMEDMQNLMTNIFLGPSFKATPFSSFNDRNVSIAFVL